MRLGREMEDIAVARWTEDTGINVRRCGLLANREQPWMLATPDRLTADGSGLEVKTTTWRDHSEEWDAHPSDHAMAQAQWSMAVTGLDKWHIVALFRDTGEHTSYEVERDDALIEILVLRASQFWHGNILQRCAPPLDETEATLEATRALHPTATPGTQADGGEQAAAVRRRQARIQAQIKALEAEDRAELATTPSSKYSSCAPRSSGTATSSSAAPRPWTRPKPPWKPPAPCTPPPHPAPRPTAENRPPPYAAAKPASKPKSRPWKPRTAPPRPNSSP